MKKLAILSLTTALALPMAAYADNTVTNLKNDLSAPANAAPAPANAENSGQEQAAEEVHDTGHIILLKNGNRVEVKKGEAMVVSKNGSVPLKDGSYETKSGHTLTVKNGHIVHKHSNEQAKAQTQQ